MPRDEDLYAALQDRFFGKYRGEVVNNTDPEKRGRLEVLVPNVMGPQAVWALPCVPYAGPGEGFFALPPAGAKLWVEFEGGDTNFPVWTGCFWGSGEIDAPDAGPAVKFLRTPAATVRIDDAAGTVTVETTDGARLTLGAGEIRLEAPQVTLEANGARLVLTPAGLDVMNGAFAVN
ncbi:phage baseplate assembly protein V [Oceanicella sp. SM1341]|uniref:phage baseplate assembly protein V n=1 Tax=Oceanicella sp. SM1341 TaxID=1548889 RepID=UPI000E47FB35|nr:phage baseplate assembly protein V [Oceanicella sp. SM1341]